ncbi:hypothetical protein [Haliscomenobacter hydrossis]|uniref:Uncharacterized protein n=1 Tax=Haliscomenobacter hydrossis (strain ATCC 27775 / DSM 1100 / LMG 10767 / O) TaxID=760192 RepID=F4L807_HALH1|nr:hypothetical protein [Haliscomenobacter hydrossis]AEE54515.1 hypothetical protein Halhy_6700 [Haliscomenobacter hydrossis DSM 1100]
MKTNSEKTSTYHEQTRFDVKWAKSKNLLAAHFLTYNTNRPLAQQLRSAHQALAEKLLYLYSVSIHYHQAYVAQLLPGTIPLPALWTNNVQLAQMLTCSERTVQNLRQRLRSAGIITHEVWHGTNCQYELFLSPQILHLQRGGDPDNQVDAFFVAPGPTVSTPQPQTLPHTVTCITVLDTNKLNKLSGAPFQQAVENETFTKLNPVGQLKNSVEKPEMLVENPPSDSVLDTFPELFSGYETTSDSDLETPPPFAAAPPNSQDTPKRRRRNLPQVIPQVPQVSKVVKSTSSAAAPKQPSSEPASTLTLPEKLPPTLTAVYAGLSPTDQLLLDRQVSRMASVASTVLYADRWICDPEHERMRIALAEYLRYAPAANYTRGANEVVERMHLVRRWIDAGLAAGQKRWVPLPAAYFDVRNRQGFVATKAWFKKHQQAKIAIKDRELLTKAVNFYLASLRPEAVIAPVEAYRRVTQSLGKRKAELVQLFHAEIQNTVPHVNSICAA